MLRLDVLRVLLQLVVVLREALDDKHQHVLLVQCAHYHLRFRVYDDDPADSRAGDPRACVVKLLVGLPLNQPDHSRHIDLFKRGEYVVIHNIEPLPDRDRLQVVIKFQLDEVGLALFERPIFVFLLDDVQVQTVFH